MFLGDRTEPMWIAYNNHLPSLISYPENIDVIQLISLMVYTESSVLLFQLLGLIKVQWTEDY